MKFILSGYCRLFAVCTFLVAGPALGLRAQTPQKDLPLARMWEIVRTDSLNSEQFLDLLARWSSLDMPEDLQKVAVRRIDSLFPAEAFACISAGDTARTADYTRLQECLKNPAIPLVHSKRCLVDMWVMYGRKDPAGILEAMGRMFGRPIEFSGILDWVILGHIGNYLLENCSLKQCSEAVALMDEVLKKYGGEEMVTVKKLKEDFEGRKMMMEMGME